MSKLKILNRIRDIYNEGGNIMEYLNSISGKDDNDPNDVMISYDFQAGTYVTDYNKEKDFKNKFLDILIEKLNKYNIKTDGKILEIGVGEATTLIPFCEKINKNPKECYGFDISWSRIKMAKKFAKEKNFEESNLFLGDVFSIPLKNNSIDFVYTCFSICELGGKERDVLKEIYRVSKNKIVLIEPAYELAGQDARKRMDKYRYTKNLKDIATELGYKVLTYELLGINRNELTPTGLIIIEKIEDEIESVGEEVFACPITRKEIKKYKDAYYSRESMLLYPIVGGISCLVPSSAIVATKYLD